MLDRLNWANQIDYHNANIRSIILLFAHDSIVRYNPAAILRSLHILVVMEFTIFKLREMRKSVENQTDYWTLIHCCQTENKTEKDTEKNQKNLSKYFVRYRHFVTIASIGLYSSHWFKIDRCMPSNRNQITRHINYRALIDETVCLMRTEILLIN